MSSEGSAMARNAIGGSGRGGMISNTSRVQPAVPGSRAVSCTGRPSSADVSTGGAAVSSDVSCDRSMLCLCRLQCDTASAGNTEQWPC